MSIEIRTVKYTFIKSTVQWLDMLETHFCQLISCVFVCVLLTRQLLT